MLIEQGSQYGMIVSSCLLEDGKDNEWSRQKIKSFMDCVHGQ